MASLWHCASQTEISSRSNHWKCNTTVKMSYRNAFPFQNMQHFIQIPKISKMASRQFGSDIYVILFRFWHVFEVHSQCLIFFFLFESQSLYFSCSALFLYLLRAFSLHIWVLTYISPRWPWNPLFFHPLRRPVNQRHLAASRNDIELLAKYLKTLCCHHFLTDVGAALKTGNVLLYTSVLHLFIFLTQLFTPVSHTTVPDVN